MVKIHMTLASEKIINASKKLRDASKSELIEMMNDAGIEWEFTETMIEACKGKVLVVDLEQGEKVLDSGIIIPNDDGKSSGIRARWAKVYSVGSDITEIKANEWILVEHGRWSRTIEVDGLQLNLVDYPKGILAASSEKPDQTYNGSSF